MITCQIKFGLNLSNRIKYIFNVLFHGSKKEARIINNCVMIWSKNYVDIVRPKYESQHSKNALYITTEGKPFTPRYLDSLLSKTGKMVYPLYQPYTARHWCATARLIKAWIERDPDPIDVVWHFMGHEDRSTTEGYVNQARVLFKKYPYDWIKRTLKFPKKLKEESALKSKQRQKTPVSNGKSGEAKSGPAEI